MSSHTLPIQTPMRVLCLIPPMTQLNTPYPSSAYLTGFMREQGIDQEKLVIMLDLNPHATFEFFDQHKLYISIMMTPLNNETRFQYMISDGDTNIMSDSFYTSRGSAEKAAELHVIPLLNDRL